MQSSSFISLHRAILSYNNPQGTISVLPFLVLPGPVCHVSNTLNHEAHVSPSPGEQRPVGSHPRGELGKHRSLHLHESRSVTSSLPRAGTSFNVWEGDDIAKAAEEQLQQMGVRDLV